MSLRIGLAGATGALGGEVLRVLDRAPWRPAEVVPLASPTCSVPYVEYGGDQLPVDDLEDQALDELDALLLCVPAGVALDAARRAAAEGVPVVDCSGALAREEVAAPVVVPWINPEALSDAVSRGVAVLPGPAALLLAGVLGPLARGGLDVPWHAVVLEPASTAGREGVEELSRQVVALFNQGTPPRKVFGPGLAFDLLPLEGTPGADGWTTAEIRAVEDVRRITGVTSPAAVTRVRVPVFSGIAAEIHLLPGREVPVDAAVRILGDGGVRFHEDPAERLQPRPRRVEGEPFVHAGRLRSGPGGLHLWASMDNLKVSAVAAVGDCAALLRLSG